MTESTKIDFRHRRVRELDDVTDMVAVLFPGNQNQQHAAARILLDLKTRPEPLSSLSGLTEEYSISRRTLERTRAKLARLGLIEHLTWMNSRSAGCSGWKLSGRMSSALRLLADKVDTWRRDDRPERRMKDEQLAGLIR